MPWNELVGLFTGTGDAIREDRYRTKAYSLNGIDPDSWLLDLKQVITIVDKARRLMFGKKKNLKFAQVIALTKGQLDDRGNPAEPSAMAMAFGEIFTDNLIRYCSRGYLDRVFQLPSPLPTQQIPRVVSDGRPKVDKYSYSPNGPDSSEGRFHLVTVNKALSPNTTEWSGKR